MADESKITLADVAQAFSSAGLDPAVELVKAIKAERQLIVGGIPQVDHYGQPVMTSVIEPAARLKLLMQLLEYTQPRLKAVEMKMTGSLDLSTEQLNYRLGRLLTKAGIL